MSTTETTTLPARVCPHCRRPVPPAGPPPFRLTHKKRLVYRAVACLRAAGATPVFVRDIVGEMERQSGDFESVTTAHHAIKALIGAGYLRRAADGYDIGEQTPAS